MTYTIRVPEALLFITVHSEYTMKQAIEALILFLLWKRTVVMLRIMIFRQIFTILRLYSLLKLKHV